MWMDAVTTAGLFGATVIGMFLAFEFGYRIVSIGRRTECEKESSVSGISGVILGLAAFMLAFSFSIVADRYSTRKDLVRQEANAIGTAYLRTDVLPEADRLKSRELLRLYVDNRLEAARSQEHILLQKNKEESARIHNQLWSLVVTNAHRDLNSDMGALYMESINNVIDINELRVALIRSRVPVAIWSVLYILVLLGMISIGYQTAVSKSGRSWITLVLVLAFSLVIALIATLDHAQSVFIHVSQQPLVDVRAMMQ